MSDSLKDKLTFEDFHYYFKKCRTLEGVNKLLYVDDTNREEIFKGFLEHKDWFLPGYSYQIRTLEDGTIETYSFERGHIHPANHYKTMDEVYLEVFEDHVFFYNRAIENIIKRPGPAAGKKFPELFTMKREPWGD